MNPSSVSWNKCSRNHLVPPTNPEKNEKSICSDSPMDLKGFMDCLNHMVNKLVLSWRGEQHERLSDDVDPGLGLIWTASQTSVGTIDRFITCIFVWIFSWWSHYIAVQAVLYSWTDLRNGWGYCVTTTAWCQWQNYLELLFTMLSKPLLQNWSVQQNVLVSCTILWQPFIKAAQILKACRSLHFAFKAWYLNLCLGYLIKTT